MKAPLPILILGILTAGSLQAREVKIRTSGGSTYFESPSAAVAANAVADGDTITISAGHYDDAVIWAKNNLYVHGVGGDVVVGNVVLPQGAIWYVTGNNFTVNGIQFTGTDLDANNPGIRAAGMNLTVRHCQFHDIDYGILALDKAGSAVVVENSEFNLCGDGNPGKHNIEVGKIGSLYMWGCWIHAALGGSGVVSRAASSQFWYNRIMDEDQAGGGALMDFPLGGWTVLVGNVIERGSASSTSAARTILNYGESVTVSDGNPSQELLLVNNTMVNNRTNGGTFVQFNASHTAKLTLANNIFLGPGNETVPTALPAGSDTITNLRAALWADAGLINNATYDYRLTSASPAIGAATSTGLPFDTMYLPTMYYIHPERAVPRRRDAALDIGAFEESSQSGVHGPAPIATPSLDLWTFPNPAFEGSDITLHANADITQVDVFNSVGMCVATIANAGSGEVRLAQGGLKAGIYYARVRAGNAFHSAPFVIIN